MTIGYLLRGLLIGFSVAAPVGPVGLLCMRRTLHKGKISGLISGLGAATADTAYSCVAAYGLTFVSDALLVHRRLFHVLGGVFLCILGVRTYLTPPSTYAHAAKRRGLFGDYVSTLFLTLTNPMTILAFLAIFAALGLSYQAGDYITASELVTGVFLGSTLWWFLLSEGVGAVHHMIDQRTLQWINRVSGVVIAGIGLVALVR